MIAYGLNRDQFKAAYEASLMRAKSDVVESLRAVLAMPVPDTVNFAEVQIFMGDDGLDCPAAWIYYRGRNNKVDRNDPSIFPGRSLEIPLSLTTHDEFDEEYILNHEFGGLGIAAKALKTWFAVCWSEAGGNNYKVPVTLHVHDDFDGGGGVGLTAHR